MSDPGVWQLPLIAVGVGFHLAVSWALLWRYFQARERSLLTWGLAWLLLGVHVLGLFLTGLGMGATAGWLGDLSLAGAAIALFAGQTEREGRSLRSVAGVVAAAAAAITLALLARLLPGAPVTAAATAMALLCFGGAAYMAFPHREGRNHVTHWLLFGGYVVGAAHSASYLGPAGPEHSLNFAIGSHMLFSLLLSAAVTWQAWEHERAVRLFSRTLQRLNRPLTTTEAVDEALQAVADVLRVSHGWMLLRENGRGDAAGDWTIAGAIGFPEWSQHGLNRSEYPMEAFLCLSEVNRVAVVSDVNDLACVRLSAEQGHTAGRHLTIPLGQGGEVQGILVLLVPASRFYAPAEMEMLTALGEQIGLALDRARLHDELRAKEAARSRLMAELITAQEDERRRIARELHDETGQALTALVVSLDFLARHPLEGPAMAKQLAEVKGMAEGSLAEVRRVIHEMRPTVLDDLGLEAAIRWLCHRYEPTGLAITVETKRLEHRLPGPVEITVFRLIQEACTNTVKHARAKRLQIRVENRGSWLTVEVFDDGCGIDLSTKGRSTGMGLAGLSERVALAGGSLTVESKPGAGTRLFAELPLPAEGAVGA